MRGNKAQDAHAIHAGRVGGGGLTDQVVKAARKRKANAAPAGGGGGGWQAMNEKMAKRRAAQANGHSVAAGATFGAIDTPKQTANGNGNAAVHMSSDAYREPGADAPPAATGTSIFDPVLCELVYRWFCPPGGLILDPFAGGSVRGIVASRLGRRYVGIDLREEQIAANRAQLGIAIDPKPEWLVGEASIVLASGAVGPCDLVFSCPPYGSLEVYSDDPADLSTMADTDFDAALASIVRGACALLLPDRFAAFVVGDYRDSKGFYRNLPGRTVAAFEAAGLRLYNEAILVTAVGSLPVRARKQFVQSRKLGKTHQNLLVFCKGDPRKAVAAIGPVEFGDEPFDDDGGLADDGA